jgi:anti-sigma regulatory factor (Ser/Thr protein kinase)
VTGLSSAAFTHAALIVDSDEGLRSRLLPAVRQSLDAGLPVLMVVSRHTERLVRGALGARSDEPEWADTGTFSLRLGFVFEEFRRYLAAQHRNGRRVHVVAEPDIATGIDPDSPVDRAAAYLSYEAMCNEAYAGFGCPVTCLWDSRRHSTLIIENVRSLHNHEITESGTEPNATHVPAFDYLSGRNHVPLPALPAAVDMDLILADPPGLIRLRAVIAAWAERESFAPMAAGDVVMAVAEVATNGLVHGGAPVRVRAWRHSDTLVVQVDDAGGIPLPPMAGYLAPSADPAAGRGLWLARQLTDVLIAHTVPGLTSVRLHFPHEVTHRLSSDRPR